MGEGAAVALVRCLQDQDDEVRSEVAFALGEIGEAGTPAVEALKVNASRDRSAVVRDAAKEAIEKLTEDDEDDNQTKGKNY